MNGLPDIIYVVDTKKERICIQEAHIKDTINRYC